MLKRITNIHSVSEAIFVLLLSCAAPTNSALKFGTQWSTTLFAAPV
jgi:hypothetical protein